MNVEIRTVAARAIPRKGIFVSTFQYWFFAAVFRIRIRIHRIHMFLGLPDPDPDPLVRGMDPDPSPDPDRILLSSCKNSKKTLIPTIL